MKSFGLDKCCFQLIRDNCAAKWSNINQTYDSKDLSANKAFSFFLTKNLS